MTKAAELAKMGEVITNSQIGGRRNILINGAMNVAQRSTSVTGLGDGDEGYVAQDRWRHTVAAGAGRYTATQTAITDLPGFANCFKMACTTADTSIAATERFMFVQRIEGQDLQQLKKGTSDAEKVTVSFYVKGHDSATYVCALYDVDNDRFVGATFPVTTSWARQTITFPADTTGALGNDNTNDLELRFILHAGSNFTSGTLATAWESATVANFAVGINSIFESDSATFFLTGVQLEVGSQATPFEYRSLGEEKQLCYRYYYRTPDSVVGGLGVNEAYPCMGNMDGTQTGAFMFVFPVPMRAPPTAIEQSGTSSHYSIRVTSDSNGTTGPTATGFTSEKALVNLISSGAGKTSGDAAFMRSENDSSFIAFSAEL